MVYPGSCISIIPLGPQHNVFQLHLSLVHGTFILPSGIAVVVGLSSQNRIRRNVLRTDVSSLQSLISLFSLCSSLLLCRCPFSRGWVGCCCFSGDYHLGLNLGNYPCLCCQPGFSMLCLVFFLSHLFSCMICPDF